MNALLKAIYDKLCADTTLTALLSTHAGLPAIFTSDIVPRGTSLPYCVMGLVSDEPYDTKDTRGRSVIVDIQVWYPSEGSVLNLNAAAERVRTLLHRVLLTVEGFNQIITSCSGPMDLSPDPIAWGRNVELRTILFNSV